MIGNREQAVMLFRQMMGYSDENREAFREAAAYAREGIAWSAGAVEAAEQRLHGYRERDTEYG